MKTKLNKQKLDTMSKDPGNWKGIFYYNPKDPRVLVPKRHPSYGLTLNFASPVSYITVGTCIIIGIAIAVFAE